MDVNGQRFWQFASADAWRERGDVVWDASRRALQLVSRGAVEEPTTDPIAAAEDLLARAPAARDAFGSIVALDPVTKRLTVRSPGRAPTTIGDAFAPEAAVTDVVVDFDGVLWVVVDGDLRARDLRDRWEPRTFLPDEFEAWRAAPCPDGGLWVLGARGAEQTLARVRGLPLSRHAVRAAAPGTFRPIEENADPPRLAVVARIPEGRDAVAVACGPDGRVGVLAWATGGGAAVTELWTDLDVEHAEFTTSHVLEGALRASSLAWHDETCVAVRVPFAERALLYDVAESGVTASRALAPRGDLVPLQNGEFAPFVHGLDRPPHYERRDRTTAALRRLSLPRFATAGSAIATRDDGGETIDGGRPGATWHRLCLEATIPPRCGITVELAASDDPTEPIADDAWFPHRFGAVVSDLPDDTPRGVWLDPPTELPFVTPLLDCAPVPDRNGLFAVVVQRAARRVRSLRGRYLRLRIRLDGDGRSSPRVAALRVWGSRFSYRDRYLPELYGEDVVGRDADDRGVATGADFLERFLTLFEGVMTDIEDRVANAHRLVDARSCPDVALPWLASWVGVELDPAVPVSRQRRLLEKSATLQREHGTRRGLERTLDVVTGGLVSDGAIVVVEDFLLRRTFATVLGADLADEADPLLAGLAVSGNSIVGDSLLLGAGTALADEHGPELLALFGADQLSAAERDAVRAFFDGLAYRVTVLVHEDLDAATEAIVRRVTDRESPAHVVARVLRAGEPLLVGVASLVGVDTFLRDARRPDEVVVARTEIGVRDRVRGLPALDPRYARGASLLDPLATRPLAAGENVTTPIGDPFVLDASRSRAARGRSIATYRWRLLDEE